MNKIVTGIDGSEHARRALRWAIDEARLRDAVLVVVHAWHPPYMGATALTSAALDTRLIAEGAERLVGAAVGEAVDAGIETAQRRVVQGSAAHAILTESEDATMIVVGARGLGGFAGLLLGSVSQQVAQHARCPVLVVPG